MVSTDHEPFYREVLKRELESRKERNPRYSLRAFARSMAIDHGILSAILSGKRVPSVQVTRMLPKTLGLNPDQSILFERSVAEERRQKKYTRINNNFDSLASLGSEHIREITIDQFEKISQWYHYAILEMTFTADFDSNPVTIGKRLGISEAEAVRAVQTLLDNGFLREEAGRLIKTDVRLLYNDFERTSHLLQTRQSQILKKADEALWKVPLAKRDHTDMVLAIDPAKLDEARRMVSEFSRTIATFLEAGKQKEVYQISIALFPLEN